MPRSTVALSAITLACVVFACRAGAKPAGGTVCDRIAAPPMYAKKASLQETLSATRQLYRAWQAEQPAARKAVTFGPWLRTAASSPEQIDLLVLPETPVDPSAKSKTGQALWQPQKDLIDSKVVKLPGSPPGMALYLARTLSAKQAVRLTVGIGGGDRLAVWLNGQPLAASATHLVSGRYGCSRRVDGTRVDQLIVDLDLRKGDNTLVVRLTTAEEPSFCFSPAPCPIPRLWEQLRRDFPAAENPLLDDVDAAWFDADGWFASRSAEREQSFLARLAGECCNDEASVRAALEQLRQAKVGADDRRWLDLCVKVSVLATLRRDLGRLRAAVDALGRAHPDQYPAAELQTRLDDYARRLATLARGPLDPCDETTRRLMAELPPMRRSMLVGMNPLLKDAEILFVKRYTYNSKHYYDDFQHISRLGGNLCVLSLADGQVREVVSQLRGGVFDRYDLSFDARRIVFGYRRPKPEGYRIWEVGVDGSGLRQVTHTPEDEERRIAKYGQTSTGDSFYGLMGYQFWTDDVHPCYLPDGGLCFASTRCEHGVLCTPNHYLACTNLFRMEADGSGLRPISHGALSEFTPTMMEDGRILYNRWEYVYKGIGAVQPLWVTRPDGSASEEFYGDNVTNPGVHWQARQVPGHPRLAVCIGCGHEPLGVGQVLLLDLNKSKRTLEPMQSLTPNVKTQNLRGLYQLRNGQWREDIYGPFYADPYPLSDKFFLVACNPEGRYNDQAAYGIYLLDVFGNRVPIYHDPEISSWQPMPLRPRKTPPVLPSQHAAPSDGKATATVFLSDVYRGLEGIRRGTVKYLRVMEQVAKPWSAEVDPLRGEDRRSDGFGGHLVVSHNAHIWVAVLRGIVPVAEDGSAVFEVPAGRNLFFQALDKDYMQVQRMRTFVNFAPGEQRSCIGCHEHRTQAPVSRPTLAMGRAPSVLGPQPGEVAPRPLHYPSDVQPILDRHCTSCHNGTDPKAAPDLRGQLTTLFNRSYENIFQAGLVNTVREWAGGSYAMQNVEVVAPYQHGSHSSKLVDLLRKGHYDVKLSTEEWIKLVTWIDCGAPYYGSYYGRRHLRYQGQPDFRPVPTVASACGIAPDFAKLPELSPLPAKLLARWTLDDKGDEKAADASGAGHDARLANLTRSTGPGSHAARRFDGRGYLACDDLGEHAAVSIAMWVKPDSLDRRWNPLCFGDDIRPGVVHFSLLASGIPNVAINTDGAKWTHRTGSCSAAPGAAENRDWHHVTLVCDARFGGSVQFYIDGRPAGRRQLSLGIPLTLDGFRVGAWNRWESSPTNNYHGEIADVRIYRGILTREGVARLVEDPPASRSPTPTAQRDAKHSK